jgi:hypothetical protein
VAKMILLTDMFIWGWGKQLTKEFGSINGIHCPHCNNDAPWLIKRMSRWFTFFFIPVIPYSWEYLLICSICSYGAPLDKKNFEEMKALSITQRMQSTLPMASPD